MSEAFQNIKSFFLFIIHKILSYFPTQLPRGTIEFNKFYHSLLDLYGFPDNIIFKHAVASAIMHLKNIEAYKSKNYFGLTIKKAQANSTAFLILEQIREQEKAEAEKAKLSGQAQPN